MAKLWDMMQRAEAGASNPKPRSKQSAPKDSTPVDIGAQALPRPIAKPKRGRPMIEERDKTLTATKPWLALGMSRSSWYLRQAKDRESKL
jgi:hypothetical protein